MPKLILNLGTCPAKIYSQPGDVSKPKFILYLGMCSSQKLFSIWGRVQAKTYSQAGKLPKPKFILN